VLDNAEQHAGGSPEWYTIGYYDRLEDPEDGGTCHIVLLNFGQTIYESLNSEQTSPEMIRAIKDLADTHRSRGWFKVMAKNFDILFPIWEEQALWTLYSLQEGVSRFRNLQGGEDRGNGTVKMIEFFSDVASGNPQMALVSGRTHIFFDNKYKMATRTVAGGEQRKVIAFNESNDLNERPDHHYVKSISGNFPGTLISLRFQLRRADLANIRERLSEDAKIYRPQ
jgi:hypothetical protein